MLTPETSTVLLEGLVPTVVFNGHDHYGCYHIHEVTTGAAGGGRTLVPEYTVRSIQGDFGGYVALFEILKRRPGGRLLAAPQERFFADGDFEYHPSPYGPPPLFFFLESAHVCV